MVNLSSKYMGLTLKSPVIAGSSGYTKSVSDIRKLEEAGAGAVVLKSIFEEQIRFETDEMLNEKSDVRLEPMLKGFDDIMGSRSYDYAEALEYLTDFAKEHTLNNYLDNIKAIKREVNIPVIASINCIFAYDWHFFAKKIQEAGADAIELNIYILPSDLKRTGEENEKIYFEIINSIKKYVSIPVSIKVGYYFSGLGQKIVELSNTGISGMVLFNRPFSPDIDIDNFEVTSGNILSSQAEYSQTLRWIAILNGKLGCDIAAATGVHDPETLIKYLLAGANAVQVVSAIYKHGFEFITQLNEGLKIWMEKHKFNNIDEFRGKISQYNATNPAVFERVQFMKLYSKIE
jgi:dihydroorotate dehydrogenase (fumarate)